MSLGVLMAAKEPARAHVRRSTRTAEELFQQFHASAKRQKVPLLECCVCGRVALRDDAEESQQFVTFIDCGSTVCHDCIDPVHLNEETSSNCPAAPTCMQVDDPATLIRSIAFTASHRAEQQTQDRGATLLTFKVDASGYAKE